MSEREPEENLAPRWEKWRAMPSLSIVEAVALSLNLDPKHVSNPWTTSQWERMSNGEVWAAAVMDRLTVLERVLKPGQTQLPHVVTDIALEAEVHANPFIYVEVKPKDFVKYCIQVDWSVPREMLEAWDVKAKQRKNQSQFLYYFGDESPDWTEWRSRPIITLWEAAALSLQMNPENFSYQESFDSESQGSVEWMHLNAAELDIDVLVSLQRQFDRRAKTLDRACIAGDLGITTGRFNSGLWATIQTANAIAFLDSCGIAVPGEWRLAKPGNQTIGKWPWGDYETEALRALADAVKQFWSTYDPADPQTAPKKQDVIDYLESKGVAKASAIASIIHSDTAPVGRRPSRKDGESE